MSLSVYQMLVVPLSLPLSTAPMDNPPPAYAPTGATSYQPTQHHINANRELTKNDIVGTNVAAYDTLAEIFLILPTLEVVEKAFLKDYITDKEKYTATCTRLINQYQLLVKNLLDDHRQLVSDILGADVDSDSLPERLSTKFRLQCPLAVKRLTVGFPATIQSLQSLSTQDNTPEPGATSGTTNQRLIAQVTGNFITVMDAIKLNYNTKQQLHPLLSELVINLNELPGENERGVEFSGKLKLVNWLIKLNNLTGTLESDDLDAFLADVDTAYKGFFETLK